MHILKNGIDYRWQTSEFVKTENIVIWQYAGLELGVHMINRQKLSAALEEYKKDFDSEWEDEKYKWQAVKCFQDNWDIHAVDFAAMLAKSLKKTANLLTSNTGESVRNGR